MKTILSTFVIAFLLMVSVVGTAQTNKPGFTVSAGIGTNNVNRKTQMGTLNIEAGAFSNKLGITATYYNVVQHHLTEASGYGLKGYVKLAKIDALSFWGAAEADLYIKEIDKHIRGKFSYKPELSVSIPLLKNVGVGVGVHEFIYQQIQKEDDGQRRNGMRYKTGMTFKLIFTPFK